MPYFAIVLSSQHIGAALTVDSDSKARVDCVSTAATDGVIIESRPCSLNAYIMPANSWICGIKYKDDIILIHGENKPGILVYTCLFILPLLGGVIVVTMYLTCKRHPRAVCKHMHYRKSSYNTQKIECHEKRRCFQTEVSRQSVIRMEDRILLIIQ